MSVEEIGSKVVEVLRGVYDPEIPVNVYDLGLIYELKVSVGGEVYIKMTLTAPGCPIASSIVNEVYKRVREIPGVKDVKVELTFEPPWNPTMIREEGREILKAVYGYDIVSEWVKRYKEYIEDKTK